MTAPAPPPPVRSPLDLDHATMQALGRQVADVVAAHLATLRAQPVLTTGVPAEVRRRLAAPAPEEPTPFDVLLATLQRDVLAYAAREPHPGFLGYVPGAPTFPAVLGDWLATGYNLFAGVWPVAEGPNALELTVLEWFRTWVGMPAGTGGLLTNGGSGATLTAVVAARHAATGDDAARLTRLTLYTSDQAHSAVQRAAWIAGVPRANVRVLPSDAHFRLDVAALRHAVAADRAAGHLPFLVAANAGTTNTGAVDPLEEIADVCAADGLWLHADAAYGGFAVLTERGRRLLAGLGRCDSVALDPHKWLFVPFECGGLLVRDPARLRAAFAVDPDYLRDVAAGDAAHGGAGASAFPDGPVNFSDYGEQLTRQARALKVWLGVRYFGLAAIRAEIDRAMALAAHAERLVRAEPTLEVLAPAQLGVLCFRVRPPTADPALDNALDNALDEALNARVNAAVNADGRYLVSSTRLRGTFALRLCVLGYRTTAADVEGLIGAVVAAGARELARARPPRRCEDPAGR